MERALTKPSGVIGPLQSLRLKALNWCLYSTAGMKLIALIVVTFELFQGEPNLSLIGLYVSLFILILIVAFVKSLGFTIRAYCFLINAYILGIAEIWTYGIASLGLFMFLSTLVFCGLMFGQKRAALWLAITLTTYILLGVLYGMGMVPITSTQQAVSTTPLNWISPGVVFTYMSLMFFILITLFLNKLQDQIQQDEVLVTNLTQEVTQRRRAESIALEREEELSTLMRISPVGIVKNAPSGRVLYTNEKAESILGRRLSQASGTDWIESVHPDDRERLQRSWKEAVRNQYPFEEEYRVLHHNGKVVWVLAQAVPYHDANDQDFTMVGTLTDITERKRNQEERAHLQLKKSELEDQLRQSQKMEAIGQLAGGIAHDFNNLLMVIGGSAHLAQQDLPVDSPAQGPLAEVKQATEKAATLVRQLLAFSRRQVIHPKYIDPNDVFADMLKLIRRLIGEHIQLVFRAGEPVGGVWADRGMLEQVLMNLCLNARDSMANGGTLEIETRCQTLDLTYCDQNPEATPGKYVVLRISDSGHGMNPETLAHIFEPFFTTKAPGAGTGLGLSTVYGIVKQHRGWISVSSEIDRGTTFEIFLPWIAKPERNSRDAPRESDIPGGNETILLAEDDPSVCQIAERFLKSVGYRVLVAHTGKAALDLFRNHLSEIDLVILDAVMPDLGGRQAYEAMQLIDARIPTLFVSGYTRDRVHTEFVLDAGLEYLQKPFSREELLQKIRGILDKDFTRPVL